jgi:hypothetical protein
MENQVNEIRFSFVLEQLQCSQLIISWGVHPYSNFRSHMDLVDFHSAAPTGTHIQIENFLKFSPKSGCFFEFIFFLANFWRVFAHFLFSAEIASKFCEKTNEIGQ